MAILAAACAAPAAPVPSAVPTVASPGAASQPAPASSPAAASAPSPSAPPAPLQAVKMGVPAKSLNYLPVYLGVAQGIFAEEGLDVEVTVMPAEVSIAGLVSGSLDYSGASTAAIRANMAGAAVRSLAFMSIQPTFYIMSRPELRSLADLRGKIVATTSLGSSTTEVARTAVGRAGLDPNDDVQILATGNTANAYTTLVSGQADAAVLSVPYNVQAERDGYYPLLYAGDVTSSPESGLAASVDKLRREPDQVRRMLRGMLRGLRYVRERKPETIAVIVQEFEVAPDLADGAYDTMLRSYSRDGLIPSSALEETMATHAAQTGLAELPAVEDVTDYGPLREAQRELGPSGGAGRHDARLRGGGA